MSKRREKICPLLSAAGEEIYLCDPSCMFFRDGECVIARGFDALVYFADRIEDILEALSRLADAVAEKKS